MILHLIGCRRCTRLGDGDEALIEGTLYRLDSPRARSQGKHQGGHMSYEHGRRR
jgi:hypothetical protein